MARRSFARVNCSTLARSSAGIAIFAIVAIGFFNPVFRSDATFSTIAGHQSIQFPWAARPTGWPDSVQSDQANYVYPIEVDVSRSLERGVLPSWSRSSFTGLPTAGSAYSSMSYPGHLLTLAFLSPSWAHDVFLLLHVWLAGCSMFWLLRVLKASWLASVFGGVTWMLCPAWFGLIQLESTVVLAALLPATLAMGLLTVRRRSLAWIAACAVAQALLILGASIQTGVFSILIVGATMTLDGVCRADRGTRLRAIARNFAYAVPANLLALGLVGFVLVPEQAAIATSHRAKVPYDEMVGVLGLSFHRLGDVFSSSPPLPLTGNSVWTLLFLGTAGGVLMLVGLVSRRPGAWLGRTLLLVFLALILGTRVTWLAYHVVPGFAYISPLGRLTPFAAFGGVLLTALGFDVVRSLLGRRPLPVAAAATLLIGLQAWQLATFDRSVNPPYQPRKAAFLYPATGLTRALESSARGTSPAGQRVIDVRRGAPTGAFFPPPFVGDTPMLFGLQSIGGYFNVIPPRSATMARVLTGESLPRAQEPPVGAYGTFFYSQSVRYELLERLGVTTVVSAPLRFSDPDLSRAMKRLHARLAYSGEDGAVRTLPHALSRAFFVSAAETARGDAAALARYASPSFPFRTTVLLEGAKPEPRSGPPAKPVNAEILRTDDEHLYLRVRAPRPGWVVVLESAAPGWTATVNGKATPILHADYAFRAVRVPSGTSFIEMRYDPPGLVTGLRLSGACLACVAGLALFGVAPRRRRGLPKRATVPLA